MNCGMWRYWILFWSGLGLLSASEMDGWHIGSAEPNAVRNDETVLQKFEFSPGLSDYKLEFHQGARGKVEVLAKTASESAVLKITKSSDEGFIVVRIRDGVRVPANQKLQLSAMMRTGQSSTDYSLGMLRLLRNVQDFSYDRSLDNGGSGGPHMQFMFNTPDGIWQRRLAHKKSGRVPEMLYPAIIVDGRRSVSFWRDLKIEDFSSVRAAWKKHYSNIPGRDCSRDMISESVFEKMLENSPNHTAVLSSDHGRTRLLIDGRIHAPDFYKAYGNNSPRQNCHYGKFFSDCGIKLQVINIRYGDFSREHSGKYGIWSREKFDVAAALKMIRESMRTSPDSLFVLTLMINHYPEFCRDFPDEVWRDRNGRVVYGNHVHIPSSLQKEVPARYVPWASYYSKKWRKEVKAHTGELIAALKKNHLDRKIIGVHLGGGHDMQFSTRHLDYSQPALEAFRDFLRRRYHTDSSLQKAWHNREVTFLTVRCPQYPTQSRFDLLQPGRNQNQIDFYEFQKLGPFEMEEDIGKYIKKQFGKDILMMRWCMEPFAGTLTASLDIGAFNRSGVFDILIAQSAYTRRMPGIAHGIRLPLASMHLHRKLFLQELDLRTWKTAARETELRCLGLGISLNLPMWQAMNRKLTGQMIAGQMGYWYYDMAPGWYDDPGIAADLKSQVEIAGDLYRLPADVWHPDVAFVIDERGALLRNMPGLYYIYDLDNIVSSQSKLLAGSGVSYDYLLLDDLLAHPEIGERYKMLVWAGMYHIDADRLALLKKMQKEHRTLVFLSGTGRIGNRQEGTGFHIVTHPMPVQNHDVTATSAHGENVLSWAQLKRRSLCLGQKPSVYYSSPWDEIIREPGMTVPAVYREQNCPAIAEKNFGEWTGVYIAEAGGLTPEYFNQIARKSGCYVPSDSGLEIDMSGYFISVHALVSGEYNIFLPYVCEVLNLKSGKKMMAAGSKFRLSARAGSTYWFRLKRRN